APLPRLRLLLARGEGLRRDGTDGGVRHSAIRGTDAPGRSLQLSRALHHAEIPHQFRRRSVLPSRFLALLFRPASRRKISALRAEHRPLPAQLRRAPKPDRLLRCLPARSTAPQVLLEI